MSQEKPLGERRADVLQEWYQNKLSFEEVKKQLDLLSEEAKKHDNKQMQGEICLTLGIVYGQRAVYPESIEQFNKASKFFEAAGAKQRMAWCLLNIGESYRLLGNHVRAQSYYFKASEYARELGMLSLRVLAMCNEGQIWLSLKSYDKAEKNFHDALLLAEEWQPQAPIEVAERNNNRCELYAGLVQLYLANKAIDKAWENARIALQVAEEVQHPLSIGIAKRAVGDVLWQSPTESSEAEKDAQTYFEEAIAAFKQVDAESEVAKTLAAQGKSLAKRGQKQAASQKLQQALRIFNKLGMQQDAADVTDAQLSLL